MKKQTSENITGWQNAPNEAHESLWTIEACTFKHTYEHTCTGTMKIDTHVKITVEAKISMTMKITFKWDLNHYELFLVTFTSVVSSSSHSLVGKSTSTIHWDNCLGTLGPVPPIGHEWHDDASKIMNVSSSLSVGLVSNLVSVNVW